MKLTELKHIINTTLISETKKIISESISVENIKSFQTLSSLKDKITDIKDNSSGDNVDLCICIDGLTEEDIVKCCSTSDIEKLQKDLMQGLHHDLEDNGFGDDFSIDVEAEEENDLINLKIKINTNIPDEVMENHKGYFTKEQVKKLADNAKKNGKLILGAKDELSELHEKFKDKVPATKVFDVLKKHKLSDLTSKIKSKKKPVDEGNEFTQALLKAKEDGKDKFTVGGKEYDVKECWTELEESEQCDECNTEMKESKKVIRISESRLIKMIENIISESVPGLTVTKSAQSKSKKENDDYIKDVTKKIKDYSSFDGNDNPEFPKPIGKGKKVAYRNTTKQEEEIEDNRGGGLQHLKYDNEPSEMFKERMEMAIKGHTKMGNKVEGVGNVVPSKLGDKMVKQVKRKLDKEKDKPMYKKDPQPVKIVKK